MSEMLPAAVTEVLEALLAGTRRALAENLVGVYPRGSLATGDLLATSDLDVLTVTARPVDDAEFAALASMHERVAAVPSPYASRLELAYIDRAAVQRFTPGQRHPTLYWGEPFAWSEHRDNLILERWTVREHGVPLLGPDPKTLIEPITREELRAAVRRRLRDWAIWAEHPDAADWPIVYTVETLCRALHTLACGELSSKAHAVTWAIATLPEPWRSVADRSQRWRAHATIDRAAIEPEVIRFVRWATLKSTRRSRGRAPSTGASGP